MEVCVCVCVEREREREREREICFTMGNGGTTLWPGWSQDHPDL